MKECDTCDYVYKPNPGGGMFCKLTIVDVCGCECWRYISLKDIKEYAPCWCPLYYNVT